MSFYEVFMVTETTSQTSEATPAEQTTTPDPAGEQPLVAQEPTASIPDGDKPLVDPGTVAAEQAQSESAGEAQKGSDGEASGQQDTGSEQEPQAEATTDQQSYTAEEVKKIQSGFDSRISKIETDSQEALKAAEDRANEAQRRLDAQSLDVQESQLQRQRAEHWRNQGHTDEVAKQFAAMEANATRLVFEANQRATQAQKLASDAQGQASHLGSRQTALELAQKYGVSEEDFPLLLNVNGADEKEQLKNMVMHAKRLGKLGNESKELSEQKLAEVPAGGDANKIDSGGGGRGPQTDDEFEKAYAANETDDHDRAYQIAKKRGWV